jgi:peroxiredoxin Q/BCP
MHPSCHHVREPAIIEPRKATKGRRMAKQSRNNPTGSAATTKAAATTRTGRTASAKQKAPAKAAIGKSNARSKPPSSPSTASHSAAAKKLKAAAKPATSALIEGGKAPDFTLPRDGGGTISLSDFGGRKLVIFFYPRAGTSGCTREAVDFSRLAGDFDKAKTALLGVSADPPAAQDRFRDKYQLRTPLGSDESHAMLQAYGVWGEKSLYGKTFEGIIRTTVLIDAKGHVERIWRKVKVDGHAEAVLAAAKMQS